MSIIHSYDPSLTYGRVKQPALPAVIPHWVHYDKRCLNFTAFFKQPVYENPDENYRVRVVNIVYFLEDDSMTVIEPRVKVINIHLDTLRRCVCGVEFCHSTRNASRIRQKVENGVCGIQREADFFIYSMYTLLVSVTCIRVRASHIRILNIHVPGRSILASSFLFVKLLT